jgi:hypothetical protein
MKLIKYKQINDAEFFLNILFSDTLSESNENIFKNTFLDNLNINKMVLEKYNIVITKLDKLANILIRNSKLNILITDKNIVLFTLAALSVCLIDENKFNKNDYKKEIKSILEELKLNGIGNNLVKNFSEVIKCILVISQSIFKTKDTFDSLNNKNLINAITIYTEKYKIVLEEFCNKINDLLETIKEFFMKNSTLNNFRLKKRKSEVLSINEFILENLNISGKTLVCCDIQEEYEKCFSFDLRSWIEMVVT